MPPVVLLSLYRRLCPIADFFLFGLEAVIELCWALLRGSRRRVKRRPTAATEAGWLWRGPVAMLVLLAAPAMAAAPPAGEPGSAFPVQGEQVQHAIPAGWTLAWVDGDRSGNARYLPTAEDLQSGGASQPACTAQGE